MSDSSATPKLGTSERMRALEAELELTRGELAATVDELADRLNPKTQAERAVAEGKRLVADATDPTAAPEARKRARVVLGVAGAVAVLLVTGVVRRIARH